MNPLGLPVILTCVVIVLLVHGALLALARWQDREHPPVTGKLLRSPGEHLRTRLNYLEERTSWLILVTSSVPLLVLLVGALVIASRAPEAHGLVTPIGFAVGFVLTAGTGGFFLHDTLAARRRSRYALQGHRIVNDSLAALVPSGFKVFHDVPTDAGDLDGYLHHVVIGASGIFVIEASTPAIRPTIPGRKPQEIIYDGDQLIYPWGQDTAGLVPARRKAEWLTEWIYQLVGERIPISAVLTFPGWWVTSTAFRDIRVCNPNQFAALILQTPKVAMSDQIYERLARQLEIRCRDVEL